MRKQFIRLSTLRIQAQRSVEEHVSRWDDKKRVLNAILGGAATNKQWLDEAQHRYALAHNSTGFKRIEHLTAALYEIYRCHFRMQHSRFEDESVHVLRQKYETAYMNAALNFIEDHIHDDVKAADNHDALKQAISLLSEDNSRMARAYQQRLEQHKAVGGARNRLHDLLDTPSDAVTTALVMHIRALLHLHEATLKSDQTTWEGLRDHLNSFVEGLYETHRARLDAEHIKPTPSLRELTAILDSFASLYNPLKQFAHSKRYQSFLDERERWSETLRFLDDAYPELKKMYDWLSLPRDRVDERKLMKLYEKLAGYQRIAHERWAETQDLNPSLEMIGERIEKTLEDHHRRDFIDIMRQYNQLLNANHGPERIREFGRFHAFLGARLDDNRIGAYAKERMAAMRTEVRSEIDTGIQRLLEDSLAAADSEDTLITAYDAVIELLMEMEDVDSVRALQRDKREALEKLRVGENVLPSRRSDIGFSPSDGASADAFDRLVILDNYSLRNYVLFTKPRITLGRDDDNDIILKSSFISGRHAAVDFMRRVVTDLDSTNGVFTDNNTAIRELPLHDVPWFDLAGSMVFSVRKLDGGWSFGLQKIQDKSLLNDDNKRAYNQSLLNTTFIWLDDGVSMRIHKVSGEINDATGSDNEQIVITRTSDGFTFADAVRGLRDLSLEEAKENLSDRFSFNAL